MWVLEVLKLWIPLFLDQSLLLSTILFNDNYYHTYIACNLHITPCHYEQIKYSLLKYQYVNLICDNILIYTAYAILIILVTLNNP